MLLSCGQILFAAAWGDTLSRDSRCGLICAQKLAFSPFQARASGWLLVGGLAGTVLIGSLADDETRLESQEPEPDKEFNKVLTDIGHIYQSAPLQLGTASVLYGIGYFADKPKVRKIGSEIVQAYIIAGLGAQIVKYSLGRARPYTGHGSEYFKGPSMSNAYHSFPSGDVTEAFAFTAVLASETRSVPLTIGLLGLAAGTAIQRIDKDKHWFSDVLAGAIWGTAAGLGVVHLNHKISDRGLDLSANGLTYKF